jgi:hypothetical protein
MSRRNLVGPIPEPDELYGRDDLLDHIWRQIEGNNILLLAPRRFGKSGVMRHMLLHPRDGYLPLDFELEDVTSPEEFVWRVTRKLLEQESLRHLLHVSKRLPSTIVNWAKETFDGLEFEGAKLTFKESVKENWREVAQHMMAELEKSDRTIVFLFDEFPGMIEKLIEHGGEKEAAEFLAWFRTVRLQQKDMLRRHRFVVAGSIGIDAVLRRLGVSGQMNDFERVYVEPLPDDVALKLAEDLAIAQNVAWDESHGTELFHLLGENIPYFIHLFFSELGQLPAGARQHISRGDLERIYRERVLGPTCKHYFQYYSVRLERRGKEAEAAAKGILRTVANAPAGRASRSALFEVYQKTLGAGATDIGFDELLGDLEHDWYLVLDPTTNEYFFKVKVMQDWWKRWYPSAARSATR